jgi:hypothetical protein
LLYQHDKAEKKQATGRLVVSPMRAGQ